MKTLNKTLSLIGIAACSAVAQDIKIESSYLGITEPNKPRVGVDVPIVLTPASDFNLEFKTNRVEVTKRPTTNGWGLVPALPTRRFASGDLQSQYDDAARRLVALDADASINGVPLNRDMLKWLGTGWDVFCKTATSRTTNWTRLEGQWREVGIIVEETKARIVWNGKTNLFTLESKEVGTTGPRDLKCNLTNAFDTNITYLIWPNSSGGGR